MAGIALPQVCGMQQCSYMQAPSFYLYQNVTHASYQLHDKNGALIDCITINVCGDLARAEDIYDRVWKGTREDARIMARGLLASGYTLDRETLRNPKRATEP